MEDIPATNEEIVYYKGSSSAIKPILSTIKMSVIVFAILYVLSLPMFVGILEDLGSNRKYVWLAVAALWLFYTGGAWLRWSGVKYTLTNRKIIFERGLLSKTVKSIELWRVREIIFQRSFFETIFGLGRITLISKDLTGPFTVVGPINKASRVFKSLDDAREVAVKNRGVMAVEG